MEKRYRLPRAYKWFLGILIVGGALGIAAANYVDGLTHDTSGHAISQDYQHLHVLTRALRERSPIPVDASGKVDPFVLRAEFAGYFHSFCSSDRHNLEPTRAEIAAGDYRNFPWARARGPIDPKGPTRPLLWDPRPMPDGVRLVAFTNGVVKVLEESEFQALSIR